MSFSLMSCEKPRTEFNTHILDGYFVQSIAFDNLGNAWIGTFKQGLIKYNPNETIVYNSQNSIIADTSVIHDIAVDSKNNIWIACEGLIKYDGTDFELYHSENTPIPENYVKSIAIDSKDNIWFSSSRARQGGFVKYDNIDWTVFTPDNSDLPVNFVQSIAIDNNDDIWLALNGGVNNPHLVKISGDNWSNYTSADLGFTPYSFGNIQFNSKNQLCGAIDYTFSSYISNNRPHVFIFDENSTEQLLHDDISIVKFITVDKEDNIWCGMYSGGYAVYKSQNWTVDNSTFKEESVFCIEQSPDNKMWIGTGNGIFIND